MKKDVVITGIAPPTPVEKGAYDACSFDRESCKQRIFLGSLRQSIFDSDLKMIRYSSSKVINSSDLSSLKQGIFTIHYPVFETSKVHFILVINYSD